MKKQVVGDGEVIYKVPLSGAILEGITPQRVYEDNTFHLSTGFVVKLSPVNKYIPAEITRNFERDRPKPPRVVMPDKGREEENPDDDRYREALAIWEMERSMAVSDALLLWGIEVVESPPNAVTPTDTVWIEMNQIVHIDVSTPLKAKLAWIKQVVLDTDNPEFNIVLERINGMSGVSVKGVSSEMEGTFQS